MRLYDCTADCLVDNALLHVYVKANSERHALLKAYCYYNYDCAVADGGTVECKRLKCDKIRKEVKIL